MEIGKITGLQIFTEKGRPGSKKDKVNVIEGGGIRGDRHCDKKERQISIMTREAYEWMQAQEEPGLCFQRFKANLLIDTGSSISGAEIKAGDVPLKVDGEKQCFEECTRYQKGLGCMLRSSCWYATALADGEIHMNDKVKMDYNWNRYKRQLLVPGIGRKEQERLRDASVLVIGAGGLGSPALTVLSEAGIGHIGIMDGDVVEETNLNRQFLYTPADIGKSKAQCAAGWIGRFRPDCKVDIYPEWFTEKNGRDIIRQYDLAIVAVDRVSTRLMINQIAIAEGKPFVDGAIDGFYGTITAVLTKDGPCLACMNPEGKEPAHVSSSLGTTTMIVGVLEAQFAISYLAGIPVKSGYVLSYDGIYGTLEELPAEKDPDCLICGNKS